MGQKKRLVGAIISIVQVFVVALLISIYHGGAKANAQGDIQITGTVTNSSGNPVEDASVYATDPGTNNVDYGPVTTVSDGTYDLTVEAGTYDFHFDAPTGSGLQSVVESNVTVNGNQEINVQFYPVPPPTYTVSGYIEEGAGNPLPNVDLVFDGQPGGSGSATTNNSGYYSVTLPAGDYALIMDNSSNASETVPAQFDLTSEQPVVDVTNSNVNFTFQMDTSPVTVQVNDSNGNPVSGATVSASTQGSITMTTSEGPVTFQGSTNEQPNSGPITTNSSGAATFYAFDGTTYADNAYDALSVYDSQTATRVNLSNATTISGNTTIPLTVTVPPPTYTVSGYIEEGAGNPLPNVDLVFDGQPGGSGSATTNNSGYYSVTLPAGDYALIMDNSSNASETVPAQFDLTSEQPVVDVTNSNVNFTFQMDTSPVTVQVNDSNGNPVSGATVSASTQGSITMTTSEGPVTFQGSTNEQPNSGPITTNSSGAATFYAFDGTTYADNAYDALSVYDSQTATRVNLSNATTISGNTTIPLTVTVPPPTYTVSGYIEEGAGNPLPNVDLVFDGQPGGSGSATTNNSGYYSVTLPAGDYALIMDNSSNASETVPAQFDLTSEQPVVDVTNSNVNFTFQMDTSPVTVQVNDSNGNPVSGATVSASTQGSITMTTSEGPVTFQGSTNEQPNSGPITTNSSGAATFYAFDGTTYADNAYDALSVYDSQTATRVNLSNATTISGNTTILLQEEPPIPSAPTNLTIPSPTTAPALTWTGVSNATSYNIYANGSLIGTTTTTSYIDNSPTIGNDSYYVTAVNSAGESGPSNIVNVTVTSPTTAPTITSAATTTFTARAVSNFTVTTTGTPTPAITESGTLPTGITFTDNGDGTATLAGQASPTNNGLYALTITASSSAGTTTQTLYLSVNDAQTIPTIISTNTLTESYGVPFSFTVDTTGNPLPRITKVSGSGSLPSGVTLKDNNDGTATLGGELSKASDSGTYNFTIQAKNSNGTATQPFTLVITKTPVINNVPTKTAIVGTAYSQTITATGDPTPSLSASGLPSGLSFTDNGDGTGTISGTPSTGSGNTYTITITATNTEGSSTETFTMKVNEAPTITSSNTATATVGTSFNFQVTSTGYPNPNFNETGSLPKGVTFTNSTGAFSGTPAAGTTGTYSVTITARNSQGTDTQGFVLSVE